MGGAWLWLIVVIDGMVARTRGGVGGAAGSKEKVAADDEMLGKKEIWLDGLGSFTCEMIWKKSAEIGIGLFWMDNGLWIWIKVCLLNSTSK
ncbi:Hypothetical predicted protein [Olea europaea subsp. europaea]|uniref:Uncharacterized protein n=1 Tax=Olea europaea subsp. europaea TaxID=158383 RepID=A0A8S0RAS0_OLEEU|nr:Hypothetical predicted protein [Olea europaea subsp. europaea]